MMDTEPTFKTSNKTKGQPESEAKTDLVALADQRALYIERFWKIAICTILIAVLFREELFRLFDRWMSPGGKESHGLLIPFFSLYFIYQQRHRLAKLVGKPSWWGVVLIGLSIYGYLFSFLKGFYYPRQVMMISLIGGVVLLLGGWRTAKIVWLPVVFLIFAMPLPARLYTQITMPMRELASTVAAVLLSALPSVTCEAQGVVISGSRLGEEINLNVAEACSGMRLLLAFLALGVAMAWLEARPLFHRLVLLCSTIPIAIFCNMVRVLITGLIYIYMGAEYATGTLHTILGMVMLFLAFGLYGGLAWIMSNLFVDEDADGGAILVVNRKEQGK